MDAMPPSPPAIVLASDQDAFDAVQRLIDAEAWLTRQQQAMPALPDTYDNTTLARLLGDVGAFWAAGDRQRLLAQKLGTAMADLADLRARDGTLGVDDQRLIASVVTAGGAPAPGIELREIVFGDTPYAGALLLVDHQRPGTVLLFTGTRGWEAFGRVEQVHAAVEKQARRTLTWRTDLPGLSRDIVEAGSDFPVVSSRVLGTQPFDQLAESIVLTQRARLTHAWVEYGLEQRLPSREQRLADRLRDAMRLDDSLDIEAMLAVREARLRIALEDRYLAPVPVRLAAAWRGARDAYVEALRNTAQEASDTDMEAVPELEAFTLGELRRALRAIGVKDAPEDIVLTLDRTHDPASWLASLSTVFSGPAPVHISLLEAAWHNVPSGGAERLSARGPTGELVAPLDNATIRYMLNRLDMHTRYQQLLRTELMDGPRAPQRRAAFAAMSKARIRFEAVASRVDALRQEQQGKAPAGLSEHGWRQIEAMLRASMPVAGSPSAAMTFHQVTYLDATLRDVLYIASKDGSGVYYTPDAPDGVAFREFATADDAERLFLRHPSFREYLLDRLPAAFAESAGSSGARQFQANRRTQWVFGGNLPSGYTQTAGPFVTKAVTGNVFDASYDAAVEHALRNVRDATRSTADANRDFVLSLWHRNPAQMLPAQVVIGAVTAPFRVAPAMWRSYDAIKAGDRAQAFVNTTEAYVMALGVYALGASALHATTAPYNVPLSALGGALTARPVARPKPAFAARYAAADVRKRGKPDLHGLYHIDGKAYIAIDDQLYHAHYDATGRVVRMGYGPRPGGRSAGQAIWFHATGWRAVRAGTVRRDRGPAARTMDREPRGFYSEYINQLEKAFPEEIERRAVSHHMYLELRGIVPKSVITLEQRTVFEQALLRAEEAIRTPLQLGPSVSPAPSLPAQLQRVAPDAVPERLWLYDVKPLTESTFLGAGSGDQAWAALETVMQLRGVNGVRVTSVPPHAETAEIAYGSGLRHMAREAGFAVELRARDMVRAREGGDRPIQVLSIVGSRRTQYVLRTTPGRPLTLAAGEFRLIEELPPPTP